MLFFWNRYELPALHAGLITPQSPRMTSAGVGGVGINDGGGDAVRGPGSPPQIPHMMTNIRPRIRDQQQQQQPHQQQRERNDNNAILNQLQQPDLNDDHTSTTAPLSTLASTHQIIGNGSSSITANSFMIDDNTPISNQLPLPPAYPTPMSRFVAAASTSLQSIHTMTSNQSLSSFAERAERTSSPNWLFSGGYGFITSNGTGDSEDDDSYMAYVGDQVSQIYYLTISNKLYSLRFSVACTFFFNYSFIFSLVCEYHGVLLLQQFIETERIIQLGRKVACLGEQCYEC